MDRKLAIRRHDEHFHLIFHDFQGPYEGKQIGNYLGLEQVDPPSEEEHEQPPQLGKYFLWQAMSFHPDLHALVAEDRMPRVADLVQRMHIDVIEGKELLPEAAGSSSAWNDAATKAQELPEHLSMTEEMERLHERAWHRGPKAMISAFLIRAVPTAIIILLGIILYRHLGNHYTEMEMREALRQAAHSRTEQGALAKFWNPDYSHMVHVPLRSANFAGGERVICQTGDVLRFEGAHDIRAVLKKASEYSGLPQIYGEARDGVLHVHRLSAGGTILLKNVTIRREETLPKSLRKPKRVSPGKTDGFQEYDELDPEDQLGLDPLVGKRISLEGVVRQEGADRVLRFENNAGVVVVTQKPNTPCDRLLKLFVGDPSTLQVDGILRKIHPLVDREDPAHSRQNTKLVGEFLVYSVSAQHYHAVDRR